ncbi:eukaryotic translation initiation factor eIF2A-domain-containing protein [Chytriomyces sp. MP71]|nr:eukaryotic translation initiation factor eIF2A-domain-containing protein [Chytriomyces sp. MP71]
MGNSHQFSFVFSLVFAMSSLAPSTSQFTILTDRGVSVITSPHNRQETLVLNESGAQNRAFAYSSNGNLLAVALETNVTIYDARNLEAAENVVSTIDLKGVIEVDFSPGGTYVSTWSRYVTKGANDAEQPRNMHVFKVADAKVVASFVQKTQNSWKPQWVQFEAFFARLSSSDVHFHIPTAELSAGGNLPVAGKISGETLSSFSVSPNQTGNSFAAVFSKEKNGVPGSVKLYDLASATSTGGAKLLSTRTLFNADSVDFMWNQDGSSILVHTHTDVDKSNQSYYGKSTLHHLTTVAPHYSSQIIDLTNPVHSISWSPNSKEYIVLHGAMPSKCTLFTVNSAHASTPSTAIYEFPPAARNTVTYSPHGRLILTAGFGNLAGDFSIWDRADFKELCTVRAANASCAMWCPDGRHILTGTIYRRLKVDNGVRVFHHSGVLVATLDAKELYGVEWRADDVAKWPMKRALSPKPEGIQDAAAVKKATLNATAGKYVPPHLRGKTGSAAVSSITKV